MDLQQQIEQFFAGGPHAVVGASQDREKYGNKVLRAFMQAGRSVLPIHPRASVVEGLVAHAQLSELDRTPHGVSIVTPPEVTEKVVAQALALGVPHIWMQPGAESDRAIEQVRAAGVHLLAGGPCVLVALGFQE